MLLFIVFFCEELSCVGCFDWREAGLFRGGFCFFVRGLTNSTIYRSTSSATITLAPFVTLDPSCWLQLDSPIFEVLGLCVSVRDDMNLRYTGTTNDDRVQ